MEFITERLKYTIALPKETPKLTCEDDKHKLSFAFANLSQFDEETHMPEKPDRILKLDLTENNFTGANDLKFLIEFPNLKTLILDKNQIQSNFKIPLMPNLGTLWLNHNKIENLAIFIENVAHSCPNLTYLSMINNKASPSYFNQGTLTEHNHYRLYVISKLPKLAMLDDKEISAEERTQAINIYGVGRLNRSSSKASVSATSSNKRRSTIISKNRSADSLIARTPSTTKESKPAASDSTTPKAKQSKKQQSAVVDESNKKEQQDEPIQPQSESQLKAKSIDMDNENDEMNSLPDLIVDHQNETESSSPANKDQNKKDLTSAAVVEDLLPDLPVLEAADFSSENDENEIQLPDLSDEQSDENNLSHLPTIETETTEMPAAASEQQLETETISSSLIDNLPDLNHLQPPPPEIPPPPPPY